MNINRLFKIITALAAVGTIAACTRVEPGEVGVKINTLGSGGVQEQELGTGWHACFVGCDIKRYPIVQETVVWGTEGPDGPRISFANKDGVQTSVGVSIQVRVDPDKASNLVQEYRQGMEQLKVGLIRRTFQNAFNELGRQYSSEQLARGSTTALYAAVMQRASTVLAAEGIIIESVDQTGPVGLPENIQNQINSKVAAEQEAQRQTAQVAVVQAQAEQAVAQASGRARAIELEGAALRANPEILELRRIQNNRGICPTGVDTCIVGTGTAQVLADTETTQVSADTERK